MTGSSGSLANTDSLVRSGSIPLLAELTVQHTVFNKAAAMSLIEGLGQHVPTTLRALRLDECWREDDYDTVEDNLLVAQPIPTSLYTTFTALSIHIYTARPGPGRERLPASKADTASAIRGLTQFRIAGTYEEDMEEVVAERTLQAARQLARERPDPSTRLGVHHSALPTPL